MMLYRFSDAVLMSPAKRDRVILLNLAVSAFINIIVWIALFFALSGSTEYIVLHYNIYFGISYLGPWYNSLLLPISGLVIIVINFAFSFYLYIKEKILSYFLAVTAGVFNVLILLAAATLIYVNI